MKHIKLVAAASLLAAAVWLAGRTLTFQPGPEPTRDLPHANRQVARVPNLTGESRFATRTADHAGAPQTAHPHTEASRQEVIDQLQDAAVTYDPSRLPVIRPYLVDADPAIRTAAVHAMVVLGDAAAAPMLRDAAKLLASPDEAKSYLRQAAYLELPPVTSEELASKTDAPPTK